MLKSLSIKRKEEEIYSYFFSDAVTLYANYLRARRKADSLYAQKRDISLNNYRSLCKFGEVIEKWYLENIDPNVLINIAKNINVPKNTYHIGIVVLIEELYLSNKLYKQFEGLIPLTISEFNSPEINNAYNAYKNSIQNENTTSYNEASKIADEELKKYQSGIREVYTDYYKEVSRKFLDEVEQQAKIIVDSEVNR